MKKNFALAHLIVQTSFYIQLMNSLSYVKSGYHYNIIELFSQSKPWSPLSIKGQNIYSFFLLRLPNQGEKISACLSFILLGLAWSPESWGESQPGFLETWERLVLRALSSLELNSMMLPCLSLSRSAAQDIDSSSHLVFKNLFYQSSFYSTAPTLANFSYSVIDTCADHLAFAHLNISSACPVFLF